MYEMIINSYNLYLMLSFAVITVFIMIFRMIPPKINVNYF